MLKKEIDYKRSIDGSLIKSPVAFCRLHRKHLSSKQLRKKRCIEKNCYHLKKYEHKFWKLKAIKKVIGKAKDKH